MTTDVPYQLSADPSTNSVRLRLTGEIDIAVTGPLRTAVEDLLAVRPDAIVVDFGEVTFMDSTGIRFLVSLKNRCDAIGASWSLVDVSPSITRLIELSGLSEYLRPPA